METTLKTRAYKRIREKLLAGGMRPGSRVSEVDLAQEFGFSRTPVREAIVLLESEGLLEHQKGSGLTVTRLGRREIEEAFELREILECGAIALSAERLTTAELSELGQILDRYEAVARQTRDEGVLTPDGELSSEMVALDMAFHVKVIASSKNRRLLKMVGDVHVLTRTLGRWTSMPTVSLVERLAKIVRGHRRILRALVRRDATAAVGSMRDHIRFSRDYHLAAFDWDERQARLAEPEQPGQSFPRNIMQLLDQMESGEI